MPRPRTFDEEQALDAAMRAFWVAGYEATSTDDLCTATGLGRSSIYNTFTGKHALFLRALRRYTDERTGWLVELAGSGRGARATLRALMLQAGSGTGIDIGVDEPAGCLVVNTTVELAARDQDVAAVLRRDAERRLAVLIAIIEAGQRDGEIDGEKDPRALAQFVIAAISGMRVMARGGTDRATLDGIAATTLAAL
ncbi:TetR/AcrR family transcriptional regulator [Pseudonocardia sp. GCM10023141]|uniref:TetR/AcrR family transcriptional regulator n=1 Tax=Pseudonocardia sp. GCM10023141 TaxID=3252653 RepID=UPI003623608A